jgi:hypothetical protein
VSISIPEPGELYLIRNYGNVFGAEHAVLNLCMQAGVAHASWPVSEFRESSPFSEDVKKFRLMTHG